MKGADFPARFEARLHVRFTNGSVTETYVDDVFGGTRRPPTREAVLTKFRTNAALTGNVDDVRMLEATVLSIEHRPIVDVTRLLRSYRSGNAARSTAA
jgi:hypothetical protein